MQRSNQNFILLELPIITFIMNRKKYLQPRRTSTVFHISKGFDGFWNTKIFFSTWVRKMFFSSFLNLKKVQTIIIEKFIWILICIATNTKKFVTMTILFHSISCSKWIDNWWDTKSNGYWTFCIWEGKTNKEEGQGVADVNEPHEFLTVKM